MKEVSEGFQIYHQLDTSTFAKLVKMLSLPLNYLPKVKILLPINHNCTISGHCIKKRMAQFHHSLIKFLIHRWTSQIKWNIQFCDKSTLLTHSSLLTCASLYLWSKIQGKDNTMVKKDHSLKSMCRSKNGMGIWLLINVLELPLK